MSDSQPRTSRWKVVQTLCSYSCTILSPTLLHLHVYHHLLHLCSKYSWHVLWLIVRIPSLREYHYHKWLASFESTLLNFVRCVPQPSPNWAFLYYLFILLLAYALAWWWPMAWLIHCWLLGYNLKNRFSFAQTVAVCFVAHAKFALEHECIICAVCSHSLHKQLTKHSHAHIHMYHTHTRTCIYNVHIHTHSRKTITSSTLNKK